LAAFVAIPLARADYASTVLSQGPVAYFRLNETLQPPAATAAANSGGSLGAGANGTYNSFPTKGLPGPFAGSSALGVDGVNQSVTSGYQAGLNPAQFTIEAWVNPASATVSGGLLCVAASMYSTSPRQGWLLYQSDGTAAGAAGVGWYLRLYNTNTTAQSISLLAPQTVTPGTWTHLAFSFDGTTAKAFLNGALVNSGVPTPNLAGLKFIPNTSAQYAIGMRSDTGFPWPGQVAEVAYYGSAVPNGNIANHYTVATTTPANYATTVQADSPLVYYRFQEFDVPAANSSLAGSALDGLYFYDAKAGVAGPRTPDFPGFDGANKATAFDNGGGVVRIPPLNLNTNTVTISCWVNVTNAQQLGAGLVLHGSGANACGLTMDQVDSSRLGLGYIWNGSTYGWSPSDPALVSPPLPLLPDSAWAYAALVIRPLQAEFYLCDANNFGNWASVTNTFQVNHANQAFGSATLVGAAAGYTAPARTLKGAVDEVTIFNRALNAGELYTQYAAAVGGVKPRIFADLVGPSDSVAVGDPIVLTVDAGGTPPLTFIWHSTSGAPDVVSTSNVLTIASAALSDTGDYDVTITNATGSVSSGPVPVTVVNPSAVGVDQLVGFHNRTLYKGGTLQLTVVAHGGGLKYRWYKNNSLIASASASTFTIPAVTNSDAGSYSVVVSNSFPSSASNGPVVITIPVVANTNSYEGQIIASAPEAWWRLDEPAGSTNLFDGMGRHDGVYTNMYGTNLAAPVALGVPGALVGDANTAASFSGSPGLGLIPYSPTFSPAQLTIEGWVRTTVTTETMCPFSSTYGTSGDAWLTYQGTAVREWSPVGNGARAPLYDNGQTNAVVVYNQWTHLVMVYDPIASAGFPWTYYINGRNDTGYGWEGVVPNSGGPFIIGGRGVSATTIADMFWKGQVDEVTLYQRALPSTEIAAHYTARGVEILPPTFSGPLLSQTVTTGKNISFSTTVFGTAPALYWYKGTPQATAPVATGTNALRFNPTALTDAGTYSLVASNSLGMATNTASLTVISPVSYANVTNDLVLHLRFDTDTTDSSGRGNDGTPSSSPAPAFVPGIIGAQALQYTTTSVTNQPGTNIAVSSASYVALGTVGSGPPADLQFGTGTSFSVSLWVKLPASALPGDLPFIGTATNAANNPGWVLAPSYNGGGWQWDLSDGTGTNIGNNINVNGPANSINDGAWHNFVLTVDRIGAVADSYLDGVHTASKSLAGFGSINNNNYWPMVIGQDPTFTYPFIAGTNASARDFAAWFPPNTATVDDIGIWRRALTPLEVAQVCSAGSIGGRSFDTVAPLSVTITVTRSGSSLTLSWATGTLLESDTLGASAVWTPVPGASAPSYTLTPGSTNKFYRVLVE
jgi:hypothetical protein